MRYLGSKIKILDKIESTIEKYNIEGQTFADLFAGTGCVGDYFKSRYKIISNDFLYYSYVINKAKLQNSQLHTFESFENIYEENIFDWFNSKEYIPNEQYFFYNNYTPIGDRKFFTESNGIKIDGIRLEIEELYRDKIISEDEYYYLLASLVESVTKFSNTSGTYEAFFKFWDSRAEKPFILMPIECIESESISTNEVYNEDVHSLIRKIEGDIAYIDTPYTVTQYISAYHMLETLAKYDYPTITGVGGKRGRGDRNSLFAQKTKVLEAFEDLFRQINFKHILVSYSNQGLVSIEELVKLAELFAEEGKVYIENFEYQEYQNHRSSKKRSGKKLNEVIIYFKKDLNINKSPINYSGSKDRLVPEIIKALPEKVTNFVDVMGGAFNVGANIVATKCVYYNDINPKVYELVRWVSQNDKEIVVDEVEKIIDEYGLTKGGKDEFVKLRDDYNLKNSSDKLFVLHMYAFQNMIRFNSKMEYNTPIGVAGYSEDMKNRIKNFKIKSPDVVFTNHDYTKLEWESFDIDTIFYLDPPYFITNAAYNDGKRGLKGWNIDEETELLNILSKLDKLGYKFILSNVLEHKDKKNHILIEWIKTNNYTVIDVGTTGWRYSKSEVLIKNF